MVALANRLYQRALSGYRVSVPPKSESYEIVFGHVMEELRKCGLSGVCFQPEEYAEEVGCFSGLHVPIGTIREIGNPLLRYKLRELGVAGATIPDPKKGTVSVVIPEGLSGLGRREVCFHELSHVACAHIFEPRWRLDVAGGSEGEESAEPWRPPYKFALGEDAEDHDSRERQANLRAMALLQASIYGRKVVDRPEYFLGLENRRFPRPVGPIEAVRGFRRRR